MCIRDRVKSGDPTKLVVVIDEFQYIAKKDPTFMEAVLKLKAHRLYPVSYTHLVCDRFDRGGDCCLSAGGTGVGLSLIHI